MDCSGAILQQASPHQALEASMVMNVHERWLPLSPDEVGEQLKTLASPDDRIWHSKLVWPMVLSDGLAVGSTGGHGPVRYTVGEHVPGRKVVFTFVPDLGLIGHHMFEVLPHRDGTILRHTVNARLAGWARLTWPLLIRPLHDGAVEDMLDHVERSATGTTHRHQKTPAWVRLLGARVSRRAVHAGHPHTNRLLSDSLNRTDAVDC